MERVTRLDSTYQDAPALLDRARRELGQAAAALAEEQARRQAEEQARRQAEEQARRQAEEQARRQAEEQARRKSKRQQPPPYQPADGTPARPAQAKPSAPLHPVANGVLVFGIFGILFGITSILAVIFGRQALREIDAQPARYSGRARVKVGLILGWVFLLLYGLIVLLMVGSLFF